MLNYRTMLFRWGPALLWMAAIFVSSGTPSYKIPPFGSLDYVVKKGGHVLGYAVLALAYRRALGWDRGHLRTAWLLAATYAVLDEFHQSFVPGRHPSLLDALGFDGGGAAAALWLSSKLWPASGRRSASDVPHR